MTALLTDADLLAALRARFPTAAALSAWLTLAVWPAYKAARMPATAKVAIKPNDRFTDLDGAPLSDEQVRRRSRRAELVKEKSTGRVMFFKPNGIARGTGNWLEYTEPAPE